MHDEIEAVLRVDTERRRAFLVPVSPSANNLFITTRQGRRVTSQAYEAWKAEAGWRIKLQQVQPLPGKSYALTIAAPINHVRDLGNIEKALSDLLVTMGIIKDDRWIDDIHLIRTTEGKEMYVTLRALA